jgi:hypothetical protein
MPATLRQQAEEFNNELQFLGKKQAGKTPPKTKAI